MELTERVTEYNESVSPTEVGSEARARDSGRKDNYEGLKETSSETYRGGTGKLYWM